MSTSQNPVWLTSSLDLSKTQDFVAEALNHAEDGELYLEHSVSESFAFDDNRLKSVSSMTDSGYGLRAVMGELSAYAHSNNFTDESLKNAANTVSQLKANHSGKEMILPKSGNNPVLYTPENPLSSKSQNEKTALLEQINTYLRDKDASVKQVTVSLTAESTYVDIIRNNGAHMFDVRPLVRLSIQVTLEKLEGNKTRSEQGYAGFGGRYDYGHVFDETRWKHFADEALRQAHVNLEARPAPAGEMDVVLGAGWPGVLLHEAVGHGLEGDFNRKKTSVFSDRVGEQVASKGVTVIDQGNIKDVRGSLTFDDEGTSTNKTVLIEDGILKSYMQDRMNARLMGVPATGNGRRESYEHLPMPRMTNTFMADGNDDPDQILAGLKKGIFAPTFGGGSVDITSGQFVFEMTEAYWVENGKIQYPLKGATLIGNGPKVMQKITQIGNDTKLDDGIGTCGKAGQSVPVCVGQPTLRIDGITVGGSET